MSRGRRGHHGRSKYTVNNQIRAKEVRVIDENGDQIDIMDKSDAIAFAKDQEKDLVLITAQAKPPVAKVIELSKYKYRQQQKEAKQRKKQRTQEIKQVQLTPFMSDNDFQVRLKRITRFLEKGHKVRLDMLFRGRQITKKEFGFEMFQDVIDATEDIAEVEMEPKMQGKKLLAQLTPTSS